MLPEQVFDCLAFGHIAHKANQNKWLNTLICANAYNGTILWRRPLSPGFMLHRNTMIATEDALYLGDHESCKVFDGETGEIRDEITFDLKLSESAAGTGSFAASAASSP